MSTLLTPSLVRHLLTALGTLLVLIGLNKFVPIVDYLIANLDAIWAAVVTLVGAVTTILGYKKGREPQPPTP